MKSQTPNYFALAAGNIELRLLFKRVYREMVTLGYTSAPDQIRGLSYICAQYDEQDGSWYMPVGEELLELIFKQFPMTRKDDTSQIDPEYFESLSLAITDHVIKAIRCCDLPAPPLKTDRSEKTDTG